MTYCRILTQNQNTLFLFRWTLVIGYLLLLSEEEAQERMALFVPDEKYRCKVVHLSSLNVSPIFVAMMMNLQKEWDTLPNYRKLKILPQELLLTMCLCVDSQQIRY